MHKSLSSLTLGTTLFALLLITGCPMADSGEGSAGESSAVKSSSQETSVQQSEDGTVTKTTSESGGGGASSPASGVIPPPPAPPTSQEIGWLEEEYYPEGWLEFLPLPEDTDFQTEEFDSSDRTGDLVFHTRMGRGRLTSTYLDNLQEEGFEVTRRVPKEGSFLRKFEQGERAVYVLVTSPERLQDRQRVEIRVRQGQDDSEIEAEE